MNNVKAPFASVTLGKFGGVYTEASPENLPEGASPCSINDDFIVAGVLPRPGKQNAFNFSGSDYAMAASDKGGNPGGATFVQVLNLTGNSDVVSGTLTNTAGNFMYLTVWTGRNFVGGTITVADTNGNVWVPIDTIQDGGNNLDANFFAANIGNGPNTVTVTVTHAAGGAALTNAVLMEYSGVQAVNPLDSHSVTVNRAGLVIVTHSPNDLVIYSSPECDAETTAAPWTGRYNVPSSFSGSQIGQDQVVATSGSSVNTLGATTPGIPSNFAQFVAAFRTKAAGPVTVPWVNPLNIVGPPSGLYATVSLVPGQLSDGLDATTFGLNIGATEQIEGVTVNVTAGVAGFLFPGLFVSASLIYQGSVIAQIFPTAIVQPHGATDTLLTFTIANASIGNFLTPAVVNDATFGVEFRVSYNGNVGGTKIARLAGAQIQVSTSSGVASLNNFNYLKTFEETDGDFSSLALDGAGTMWKEDALNQPGTLVPILSGIQAGNFAQSTTLDDREFIAFSDLLNGVDIPRKYNGSKFSRLSQVGPGAPPTAATTAVGSAILSITQNPAVPLLVGPHDWIIVKDSSSQTSTSPGNVLTLYFRAATVVPSYITPGSNIVLAGFPTINGNRVNNDPAGILAPKFYTVSAVGLPIPGQLSYAAISITVGFTTFYGQQTPSGCSIQSTLATMTTAAQIPNLEVGSEFQISGTGGAPPTGYDNTWLVLATPNASQLQITSTSLSNNIATYGFNLITGTAPVIGEFVSVAQTLNANGLFNVARAIITAATAGTFSIQLQGPNTPSAAEDASGVIFGTIFQFDAFVIIGNKTGVGQIVTSGIIAQGIRKVCYSFLTSDGYMTKPSPIATFDVTSGANSIAIANLLTGPPNVVARVIHLTLGDGGNFYNIPVPVTVQDITGKIVNSSTYVNDNTTTNVVLSFADEVLSGGIEIDVEGNNLFENIELGSPVGLIQYAKRLWAIGEQNKVTNFLNWSFDGGIAVNPGDSGTGGTGTDATYPAGWTLDPSLGVGGAVIPSPVFGFAWQINYAGRFLPSGIIGMITQPAFQDEFLAPIINASTTYSVRVTVSASNPGGPFFTSGSLIVDLFSPSTGRSLGTFSLDLSTVTATMQVYSGTMLTTSLAPVPADLVLRLYANQVSPGTTILVDRVEPFPTEQPNLSGQVIASYQGNFEAFDRLTGVVDGAVQNQQPVKSAFALYDTLYLVKSGSLVSAQDNKTTEPAQWATPRVISNSVGTPSIYGVDGVSDKDSGESWVVIAGQPGAYLFTGGEPVPLTREIQAIWNQINWKYGHTLWVKTDVVNQRILIGVPLKSRDANGNFPAWLPQGVIADNTNPTTPNVILMLNCKQLNTGAEVESHPEVHSSAFTGRLLATAITRKWSIWTIKSPCGAFLKRADNTSPFFVGNSDQTGKIYQLVPGFLQDDGQPIPQIWTSHGFPTGDQEEQMQLGSVRKTYEFMTAKIDGVGDVTITVFPNTLDSPFAHPLLPDLTLPSSNNGDTEIPVNEIGTRLFVQFMSNSVGSGFSLSRLLVAMRMDPWSPVRGRNN